MDYPTNKLIFLETKKLVLLSVLTALSLGIQVMPRPPWNIEFTSLFAFVTGVVFGGFLGAMLGTLVMFVNGFFSPWGFAGIVMPFQMAGMALIGAAGGLYAKTFNPKLSKGALVLEASVLGAFLTFIYDVLTNIGTAAFYTASGMSFPVAVAAALVSGAIFSIIHIGWNAVVFGALEAPLVNAMRVVLKSEVKA